MDAAIAELLKDVLRESGAAAIAIYALWNQNKVIKSLLDKFPKKNGDTCAKPEAK